jgi:hypothetical protein
MVNMIIKRIIFLLCILVVWSIEAADLISDTQIIKFLRDGWTKIPNAVPQLKKLHIQESVQEAHEIAKLNFVVFTYRYLSVRKNVDCTIYVHQCGLWKPERYDYKNLDIDVIPNRTHEGMKLLSCCIDNARQSPTAGIKGFSSLHMIIDSSVLTNGMRFVRIQTRTTSLVFLTTKR